ncbi:MAG: hypothetical protein IJ870_00795 [Alphaproteobacteria bacterium]|nr:hypothetical protein [Alphaproteobacteria bacterium]
MAKQIISCILALIALLLLTWDTILKRKYAKEAQSLSDKELTQAIADLWIFTDTKFSLKKSIQLRIFTKEASRRD